MSSSNSPVGRSAWTLVAWAAVSVVGWGGAGSAWAQKAEAKPATARPAMTVTATRPEQADWSQTLAANGSVAAWQEMVVGAEVSGLRLTELKAQVGDAVAAGQVLAVLSAESVEVDLAQARAALAEAQAAQADAALNAERARSLKGSGALSEQQIGQMITGEQAANARVAAARAQVQAQELRLKHTQVLAPDAGVVVARLATVGGVMGSGQELFRLIRQGRLEWRAEVTAAEMGRIQPGAQALLTLASGAQVRGRVRQLSPTLDPQTRNGWVYVDLPQHPGVRAGMFAKGEFALGQAPALTLPQAAVVMRDGFNYVFVLNNEQRVSRRKVDIGRRQGDRVEVAKGLDAQAEVVVKGAGFLNDGDLVRVTRDGVAPAQR